ncbi:unnamed protein product [Lactuca virosa]|uniref:F-box domain-containing protein n=1 Tax=Lactuca virosa TaxID=75947 RepID=A0AAU9ML36_9ASTR|nr:unnamed protein product [Lactuca virosa]
MKKSERPNASIREDGVDLMSNMPDHILLLILSGLPSTEEVIRTSILSTRWRYLWTLVPSVELRYPELLDKYYPMKKFEEFVYWILVNSLDSLKQAIIVPQGLLPAPEAQLSSNRIYQLFPGISHVESLQIDLYFFNQCIYGAHDHSLPNLKTLVLITTIDAFTMDDLNRILNYYPKLESLKLIVKKEFVGVEYKKLDEATTKRILSPNHLKMVEFLEFNGEKPKLVIEKPKPFMDVHGTQNTLLKMIFSWGNKANYSHWKLLK